MGMELITDVATEPITLAQAWDHLRLDATGSPEATDHDSWLEEVGIPAARRMAERFTGRSYAPKTYKLSLDAFPSGAIRLPIPPIPSVTKVEYVDVDGATQTLSAALYVLDKATEPGWILPAYGTVWPNTRAVVNAVMVTFVSGVATIDADVRAAILLALGHLFENRENTSSIPNTAIELGFRDILWFDRTGLGV